MNTSRVKTKVKANSKAKKNVPPSKNEYFVKLLALDKGLKVVIHKFSDLDFTPQILRSPYESLVRAIAHQQLHGKAAETILGRFMALTNPTDKLPAPEEIDLFSVEMMRGCGLSNSKVKSIKSIASFVLEGKMPTANDLKKMSNEEIIKVLTGIYGVGRWTVEMMLIFQLGRLDVWPADDFGVRKGYQIWKKLELLPTAKEIKPKGEKWNPYQSIVALLMWKLADANKLERKKSKK